MDAAAKAAAAKELADKKKVRCPQHAFARHSAARQNAVLSTCSLLEHTMRCSLCMTGSGREVWRCRGD